MGGSPSLGPPPPAAAPPGWTPRGCRAEQSPSRFASPYSSPSSPATTFTYTQHLYSANSFVPRRPSSKAFNVPPGPLGVTPRPA
eukprot:3755058-Pyramimonas_sp.AAC.1